MDPLSSIYHNLKEPFKNQKIPAAILIVIFVFDFLLFPAPILAATGSSSQIGIAEFASNEAYYYISPETDDLFYFVGVKNDTGAKKQVVFSDNVIPDEEAAIEKKNTLRPAAIRLPDNPNRKIVHSGLNVITAYNSEVAQCDASPCITANGFNVCEHGIEDTVAANHLKFGTKIKIPALFGDRIFIVRDRMNARYTDRVDVWMKNKVDAIQFGVRTAKIEVVE